ncbi:MAG: hypothetical protein ABIN24_08955, partial [Dyadobacter sp.]
VKLVKSVRKQASFRPVKLEKTDKILKHVNGDTLPDKPGLNIVMTKPFRYTTNSTYRFYIGFTDEDSNAVKKRNYLTMEPGQFQTISEIGRFLKKSIDFSEDNPPKIKFGQYRIGLGRRILSDSLDIKTLNRKELKNNLIFNLK